MLLLYISAYPYIIISSVFSEPSLLMFFIIIIYIVGDENYIIHMIYYIKLTMLSAYISWAADIAVSFHCKYIL